ncbi:hypothetical protein UY3_16613 [Chelonia mydas]|uniref:Uncharacterized protein n=1 Tax=Chelonia mydas TaxID=8469 RepID=M7AP38_CHEMY|nr:hypothetical protein UY3_16613 [Chelonia mydas]
MEAAWNIKMQIYQLPTYPFQIYQLLMYPLPDLRAAHIPLAANIPLPDLSAAQGVYPLPDLPAACVPTCRATSYLRTPFQIYQLSAYPFHIYQLLAYPLPDLPATHVHPSRSISYPRTPFQIYQLLTDPLSDLSATHGPPFRSTSYSCTPFQIYQLPTDSLPDLPAACVPTCRAISYLCTHFQIYQGHDWDTLQCRVKVKEVRNAYHKAQEANCRSGAAPRSCWFYKELDVILGGDPTSTVKTPVDTSLARMPVESGPSQEEEILDEVRDGDSEAEDDSEGRDACSQELFSTLEEPSHSQQLDLGEAQTGEEAPGKWT